MPNVSTTLRVVLVTKTARDSALNEGLSTDEVKAITNQLGQDPSIGSMSQYPPVRNWSWNCRVRVLYIVSDDSLQVVIIAFCPLTSNRHSHPADKKEVKDLIVDLVKKGILAICVKEVIKGLSKLLEKASEFFNDF